MISVSEARAIMLEAVRPAEPEQVALADALGRTLAEPIIARRAQPPFRASAMDGYAVRSTDTPGVLRLIGEAGAGHALPGALNSGECVLIFTGAPLPEGADAIVVQEEARREGNNVAAPGVEANRHVRAIGVDFARGATLIEAHTLLTGPLLALAAAAGRAKLGVMRQPRVSVMGGGDEIVPPSAEPGPAQIFESASYGIAGMIAHWGALPTVAEPYRDDMSAIAATIEANLHRSELAIVIGGASVGDHDHARSAIEAIGAHLLFEKVAVRPGKPTWFAVRDGKSFLGLPGNPTSAFVCARLFLKPIIARMLGRDPDAAVAPRAARLSRPLGANGPRETYLRAKTQRDDTGQVWVEVAADQDSSLVRVFAASDVLVVRAPNAPALAAEAVVDTLVMD